MLYPFLTLQAGSQLDLSYEGSRVDKRASKPVSNTEEKVEQGNPFMVLFFKEIARIRVLWVHVLSFASCKRLAISYLTTC